MPSTIPLLQVPLFRNASKLFIGIGDIMSHVFPFMNSTVEQSGIKDQYGINGREYLAFCFTVSAFLLVGIGGLLTLVLKMGGGKQPLVGLAAGGVLSAAMLFYLAFFPKSIVNRRVKYLERNLLFALRSLLIQIRSGVPLFNSIVSISVGNYGPITQEFKNVVDKVSAGKPVVEALEELALRNPSLYFRRAMWQIINSMKSGSDVGENIEDLLSSLSKEQLVEIGRYKSILNPIAMMYMMVAVIVPSLSITLLIILSSFPGMEAVGKEQTYWIILGLIVFMQFIFLGLIKSRRPNLIGT
ncbi:MAG: type II secretion system F family protein [Candidatus Altiarchaeota archaeon]|nr:type II secretion system F family protein [Candidatus Altiarchaeota archaeon]